MYNKSMGVPVPEPCFRGTTNSAQSVSWYHWKTDIDKLFNFSILPMSFSLTGNSMFPILISFTCGKYFVYLSGLSPVHGYNLASIQYKKHLLSFDFIFNTDRMFFSFCGINTDPDADRGLYFAISSFEEL